MSALASIAYRRLRTLGATTNQEAVDDVNAIAEGGLREFFRRAWRAIGETDVPIWNWHHDAIAEHLEAVTRAEILGLVINIPPGHTKSLSASVLWPAWVWTPTVDPAHRFIAASYSPSLSRRDAIKVRNLVDSAWWVQRWPTVSIPKQNTRSATDYANSLGGWRFSTSPGGGVTGRHADTHIVDDPIKPRDTKKSGGGEAAQIEIVRTWWRETMPTRARDPKRLRRVIIMQRLHENDLAGEVIRQGGYEHLMLPARFEKSRACRTYVNVGGTRRELFEDPRTIEGELLYPQRFPESVIADLESPKGLGAVGAAAQLQQRPNPEGGDIFRAAWFGKRFRVLPARGTWSMSVDARFKEASDSGDYVAIGVWFSTGTEFYRVDEVFERLSFTETCEAIERVIRKYPRIRAKLIENKANGPAVVSVLKKKFSGFVLVEPEGGKEARANATTCYWEAGNVYLPEDAPWVDDYIAHHTAFPRGRFDDRVDETSQALLYLARNAGSSMIKAMSQIRGR